MARLFACFREAFHYKLNGYEMDETHLSWTLNAELRRLGLKPQQWEPPNVAVIHRVTEVLATVSETWGWGQRGWRERESLEIVKSGD